MQTCPRRELRPAENYAHVLSATQPGRTLHQITLTLGEGVLLKSVRDYGLRGVYCRVSTRQHVLTKV